MAAALLLAGLLEIAGTTTCPAAAEVSTAWRRLGGRPADVRRRVVLSDAVDGISITLLDESGRTLAVQRLAATGRCRSRAATAAVIVAAWLSDLRLASPATDAPPPTKAAPPPTADEPPPTVAESSPAATALPKPVVAAPRPPTATTAVTRTLLSPPRLRWALSAGLVTALTGRAAAAGGEVALTLAPARGRFCARLALLGTGPREQALGRGAASFTRAAVELGPAYRWSHGRWGLEAHAAALAALLVVRGVGFDINQQALDFDPGLSGGVRVLLRVGPVAAFLGTAVAGWLRPQTVHGADQSMELPRYDVLFVAGADVGSLR